METGSQYRHSLDYTRAGTGISVGRSRAMLRTRLGSQKHWYHSLGVFGKSPKMAVVAIKMEMLLLAFSDWGPKMLNTAQFSHMKKF